MINFNGIQIIENAMLTEAGEPVEIKRTFIERWCTLPWQPLKKTKTYVTQIPSKQIIRAGYGKFIMHPATRKEFELMIKQESSNGKFN